VIRTIGRVAEYICGHETPPAAPQDPSMDDLIKRMTPERWRDVVEVLDRAALPSRGRRADWIVAGSIFAVAVGLLFAGIPYLRQRSDLMGCQNQMRDVYAALESYADRHEGHYPQVGERPLYQTAGSYMTILRDTGSVSSTAVFACPAAPPKYPATYAYTLGYHGADNQIIGLRHNDADGTDSLAILADRPSPERVGPNPDHRYGQNVLYMGGNVRFSTTSMAGPNNDDIYRDWHGHIGAGNDKYDVVLGMGADVP
jgi:hypothetical protein